MSFIKTKKIRLLPSMLSLVLIAGLSACSLHEPTFYSPRKVEVVESTGNLKLETSQIDKAALSGIASDYRSHGDGEILVTVTYNPSDRANSAMAATDNAAMMVRSLRENGVTNVKTDILPVVNSQQSMTHIQYTRYDARMPEGCTNMLDDGDMESDAYRDYELSCTTNDYIARQVANPKDLLGRGHSQEPTDGRKRGNVVEGHKGMMANEPLEGYVATE